MSSAHRIDPRGPRFAAAVGSLPGAAPVYYAALAFGLYRRATDGRARAVATATRLTAGDLGAELGDRATFVQFSTAGCAPCHTTRAVLAA